MPAFRKKPVVVEARLFTADNAPELLAWLGPAGDLVDSHTHAGIVPLLEIEGTLFASPGDWIVKGVKGQFYPVGAADFALLYEPEP